jgi:hypothetical protein
MPAFIGSSMERRKTLLLPMHADFRGVPGFANLLQFLEQVARRSRTLHRRMEVCPCG